MNGSASGHQIEVKNLWKVFGDEPERALEPEYRDKSRTEIQEEFGAIVALRNVSFTVDSGEIFVIMGLSGSGKSTLVRCLTRLIDSTQGQIYFDGDDVVQFTQDELVEFRRHKVAMVFQHFGLLPHKKVVDNVAYGLEVRGVDKAPRYESAQEAIDTVGLSGWENYYPREMSGGMQQRVGLARALAVNPDVLLMDEPFSGLDPLIRREMQDELINLQKSLNKTIIFITHDLDEALKLGDRIVIMRDGEIIQEGTPEQIVTTPANDYVEDFVGDVSKAKIIKAVAIMQEPVAVIHEGQTPQQALDMLEACDSTTAFVVGDHDVIKGVISEHLASRLIRRDLPDLTGPNIEDAHTVSPDTTLEECIPAAATSDFPLAVVDEDDHLLGEIRRRALLAGIADNPSDESSEGQEQ